MTEFREKVGVPVRVLMATGDPREGVVYLEPQQRLIDMVNDGNPAFIFRECDSIHVLMKRHVADLETLPLRRKATSQHSPGEPTDSRGPVAGDERRRSALLDPAITYDVAIGGL